MKKTVFNTALALCLLGAMSVSITSCQKKGCTSETATNYDPDAKKDDGSCVEPDPQASQPSNPQPRPQDADAVMIGLQTVTYTEFQGFPVETAIGLPLAVFFDGASFKDVGEVTCETKVLEQQSNNSYVFIPSASDALGVNYSGDLDWTVEGGSGFPAYTGSSNGTFPANLGLSVTNGDAINVGDEFTLSTTSSILYADSVYFGIYGPEGSVVSVQPGYMSSHTFTASEMASVGTGGGFVQVAAYRIADVQTLGSGEVIYFLNEKVNTTAVTFE